MQQREDNEDASGQTAEERTGKAEATTDMTHVFLGRME